MAAAVIRTPGPVFAFQELVERYRFRHRTRRMRWLRRTRRGPSNSTWTYFPTGPVAVGVVLGFVRATLHLTTGNLSQHLPQTLPSSPRETTAARALREHRPQLGFQLSWR
ncbi:hypothetical protein [Nocardia sp. CA-120079]|uniref:hypothetical protein n=1 Tax=Nocardia sp. CA-120079 TaxID=3239974 RepID=UPI003D967699